MTKFESQTVRAARKPVAQRLATVLISTADAFCIDGATAVERVDHLTEADWRNAVTAARRAFPEWQPKPGYSPSAGTRSLTKTIIRYRLTDSVDPWAGLPS